MYNVEEASQLILSRPGLRWVWGYPMVSRFAEYLINARASELDSKEFQPHITSLENRVNWFLPSTFLQGCGCIDRYLPHM